MQMQITKKGSKMRKIIILIVTFFLTSCTEPLNIVVPEQDKQAFESYISPVKLIAGKATIYFVMPSNNKSKKYSMDVRVSKDYKGIYYTELISGEYSGTNLVPGDYSFMLSRSCTRRAETPEPKDEDIISPKDNGYISGNKFVKMSLEADKEYIVYVWGECSYTSTQMYGGLSVVDSPNKKYLLYKSKFVNK